MDPILVEMAIEDLQESMGEVDIFSKEYFFDEQYSARRSETPFIGGPFGHRSLLSVLMREGMNDIYREKIFDGKYQLGNMRKLPDEECTYEELVNEVYREDADGISANDAFETIKKGIESITGRKMKDHFKVNKSTTFKVINTLHAMKKREQQLFNLLRPPKLEKFSMSFRDAYPYAKNQEQVCFIADLKAYLSAELSDEVFNRVGLTYEQLDGWMKAMLQNVEQSLIRAYSKDYKSMVTAYSDVTKAVEDFQFEPELNKALLDELLFTYLHGLENAHFYAGYITVVNKAIPTVSVTPVWQDIENLATAMAASESRNLRTTDEWIDIGEVPELAKRWQKEITEVMQTSLGTSTDPKKFAQIVKNACNLMRADCHFGRNGKEPMLDAQAPVSLAYIVAAFCCVSFTDDESPNFKPYWHGQLGQGGSIKASNQESLYDYRDSPIDRVPEEHRHIWFYRLEWFVNALRGRQKLTEQKFAFRSAVAAMVLKICNTNYADCISRAQADFDEYLLGFLPKVT